MSIKLAVHLDAVKTHHATTDDAENAEHHPHPHPERVHVELDKVEAGGGLLQVVGLDVVLPRLHDSISVNVGVVAIVVVNVFAVGRTHGKTFSQGEQGGN